MFIFNFFTFYRQIQALNSLILLFALPFNENFKHLCPNTLSIISLPVLRARFPSCAGSCLNFSFGVAARMRFRKTILETLDK